ncbi:hypothetical protein [Mycobacterium sp. GA-2829]|uniref:hypothetical protein n=1 Tax=Mycobacterium sp. GA-2829 TaxID=1772283 RepID=UPI003510BA8C
MRLGYLSEIFVPQLGQQDDVTFRRPAVARADTAHELGKPVVGGIEVRAVTALEEDAGAQPRRDPAQVGRVNRQAAFVG